MEYITTLDEFIIKRQKDFPFATGELTNLLRDIGLAAKIVNREVNKAGLVNILGTEGSSNVSGDEVQKLDVYANKKMIKSLRNSGECSGIASEENRSFVAFEQVGNKQAKYVVVFDPLDGSSNIDVNVSVGTIFGIYRRLTDSQESCREEDFLQAGTELVAAGYVVYGTSTILVLTTGNGVNGFTLDASIGEFCLSHPNMKIPEESKYYSINQGYYQEFSDGIRNYIDACAAKVRTLRYIGSMVADVHRTLIKGGVFLYPGTTSHPDGKLRVLYECNPLSFIIEQAGGKSVDEQMNRILEIQPGKLHQRTSIVIGSKSKVDEVGEFTLDQAVASG